MNNFDYSAFIKYANTFNETHRGFTKDTYYSRIFVGYEEVFIKFTKQYEEIVEGVKCPKDGGNIIVKRTKRGRPFFGCSNYPKCDFASWQKPEQAGGTRREAQVDTPNEIT